MFFYGTKAKAGSFPTRMAEALASGVPVFTNDTIPDVSNLITQNNIGVVLSDDSDRSIERGLRQLSTLLSDPDLKNRCRDSAESFLSLKVALDSYDRIYTDLLSHTLNQFH